MNTTHPITPQVQNTDEDALIGLALVVLFLVWTAITGFNPLAGIVMAVVSFIPLPIVWIVGKSIVAIFRKT